MPRYINEIDRFCILRNITNTPWLPKTVESIHKDLPNIDKDYIQRFIQYLKRQGFVVPYTNANTVRLSDSSGKVIKEIAKGSNKTFMFTGRQPIIDETTSNKFSFKDLGILKPLIDCVNKICANPRQFRRLLRIDSRPLISEILEDLDNAIRCTECFSRKIVSRMIPDYTTSESCCSHCGYAVSNPYLAPPVEERQKMKRWRIRIPKSESYLASPLAMP